jgi:hypothetical protein
MDSMVRLDVGWYLLSAPTKLRNENSNISRVDTSILKKNNNLPEQRSDNSNASIQHLPAA